MLPSVLGAHAHAQASRAIAGARDDLECEDMFVGEHQVWRDHRQVLATCMALREKAHAAVGGLLRDGPWGPRSIGRARLEQSSLAFGDAPVRTQPPVPS